MAEKLAVPPPFRGKRNSILSVSSPAGTVAADGMRNSSATIRSACKPAFWSKVSRTACSI